MNVRNIAIGAAGLALAFVAFTFLASLIFVLGVDADLRLHGLKPRLMAAHGFPTWQFWEYLPQRSNNGTFGRWLAISAGISALLTLLSLVRILPRVATAKKNSTGRATSAPYGKPTALGSDFL